jgi:signal transduction histidine kinase
MKDKTGGQDKQQERPGKKIHRKLQPENDTEKYLRMVTAIMKDLTLIISTVKNRQKLNRSICQKLIENKHYRYVWIGLFTDRRLTNEVSMGQLSLNPLQRKRYQNDIYQTLKNRHLYYDDLQLTGQGLIADKREDAELGYSMMIPLNDPNDQRRTLGMMVIFSKRDSGFVHRETELLIKLAASLSAAIKHHEMEQKMLINERQAATDEIVGNIAHEWRQPINELGLILQDLNDAYHSNELDAAYLEKSIKEGMDLLKNMSGTIDHYRDYYSGGRQKSPFLLGEVVSQSLAVVGKYLKDLGIAVEVDEQDPVSINGYSGEFGQLLVNLLNNSREAILQNKPENPIIHIKLFKEEGQAVLTVENNGGIFTEDFHGTGWGLYNSKSVIENAMNGKVTAVHTLEGTRFRVEVPL